MSKIKKIQKTTLIRPIELKPGDMVTVYQKGYLPFTGTVIARRGQKGSNATFTVRGVLSGIGV